MEDSRRAVHFCLAFGVFFFFFYYCHVFYIFSFLFAFFLSSPSVAMILVVGHTLRARSDAVMVTFTLADNDKYGIRTREAGDGVLVRMVSCQCMFIAYLVIQLLEIVRFCCAPLTLHAKAFYNFTTFIQYLPTFVW